MDRAAIGLGSVFLRLKAEIHRYRMFAGPHQRLRCEGSWQTAGQGVERVRVEAMIELIVILASYIITLGFTVATREILVSRSVLDQPNDRSSHKKAVPRGGGWAILIVLLPGMALIGYLQHTLPEDASLISGAALLAIISWYDDLRGASVAARLAVHFLAACAGSLAFTNEQMLFGGLMPLWLDRAVMIILWTWFMNLYNFMDGIDGITGVETIAIATGTCLLLSALNITDPFLNMLTMLLTGTEPRFPRAQLASGEDPACLYPSSVRYQYSFLL